MAVLLSMAAEARDGRPLRPFEQPAVAGAPLPAMFGLAPDRKAKFLAYCKEHGAGVAATSLKDVERAADRVNPRATRECARIFVGCLVHLQGVDARANCGGGADDGAKDDAATAGAAAPPQEVESMELSFARCVLAQVHALPQAMLAKVGANRFRTPDDIGLTMQDFSVDESGAIRGPPDVPPAELAKAALDFTGNRVLKNLRLRTPGEVHEQWLKQMSLFHDYLEYERRIERQRASLRTIHAEALRFRIVESTFGFPGTLNLRRRAMDANCSWIRACMEFKEATITGIIEAEDHQPVQSGSILPRLLDEKIKAKGPSDGKSEREIALSGIGERTSAAVQKMKDARQMWVDVLSDYMREVSKFFLEREPQIRAASKKMGLARDDGQEHGDVTTESAVADPWWKAMTDLLRPLLKSSADVEVACKDGLDEEQAWVIFRMIQIEEFHKLWHGRCNPEQNGEASVYEILRNDVELIRMHLEVWLRDFAGDEAVPHKGFDALLEEYDKFIAEEEARYAWHSEKFLPDDATDGKHVMSVGHWTVLSIILARMFGPLYDSFVEEESSKAATALLADEEVLEQQAQKAEKKKAGKKASKLAKARAKVLEKERQVAEAQQQQETESGQLDDRLANQCDSLQIPLVAPPAAGEEEDGCELSAREDGAISAEEGGEFPISDAFPMLESSQPVISSADLERLEFEEERLLALAIAASRAEMEGAVKCRPLALLDEDNAWTDVKSPSSKRQQARDVAAAREASADAPKPSHPPIPPLPQPPAPEQEPPPPHICAKAPPPLNALSVINALTRGFAQDLPLLRRAFHLADILQTAATLPDAAGEHAVRGSRLFLECAPAKEAADAAYTSGGCTDPNFLYHDARFAELQLELDAQLKDTFAQHAEERACAGLVDAIVAESIRSAACIALDALSQQRNVVRHAWMRLQHHEGQTAVAVGG